MMFDVVINSPAYARNNNGCELFKYLYIGVMKHRTKKIKGSAKEVIENRNIREREKEMERQQFIRTS